MPGNSPLETALTKKLNILYPIVLAGMSHVTSASLVSAVSKAGGLGIWGATGTVSRLSLGELRETFSEIHRKCEVGLFSFYILCFHVQTSLFSGEALWSRSAYTGQWRGLPAAASHQAYG